MRSRLPKADWETVMSAHNDLDYFTRRNRQESEQAKQCIEPSARRAHKDLAELHRKAAKQALAARISADED